MNKKGRVLVAMSGGIDSSLAAVLLKEQGYEIIGITLKTGDYSDTSYIKNEALCCNNDSINIARDIAVREGFPHYVIDKTSEFEKLIIKDFINEYLYGRTPNPCVKCNPIIKSDALIKVADDLDCEFIATGHYANIRYERGRYVISKGADESKDQSYVLWGLRQENLKRTLFPLGKYNKPQIRRLASEKGFEALINKGESFEICFIPDNDYRGFLNKRLEAGAWKLEPGDFVNEKGEILGKHKGYPFYTIGQRKGLGLDKRQSDMRQETNLKSQISNLKSNIIPLYVKRIDKERNTVVLGGRESLYSKTMSVSNLNWVKYKDFPDFKNFKNLKLTTKVRYHDKGMISCLKKEGVTIKVIFEEGVFAITPGQSAVFYEGDDIVGGGIII